MHIMVSLIWGAGDAARGKWFSQAGKHDNWNVPEQMSSGEDPVGILSIAQSKFKLCKLSWLQIFGIAVRSDKCGGDFRRAFWPGFVFPPGFLGTKALQWFVFWAQTEITYAPRTPAWLDGFIHRSNASISFKQDCFIPLTCLTWVYMKNRAVFCFFCCFLFFSNSATKARLYYRLHVLLHIWSLHMSDCCKEKCHWEVTWLIYRESAPYRSW